MYLLGTIIISKYFLDKYTKYVTYQKTKFPDLKILLVRF